MTSPLLSQNPSGHGKNNHRKGSKESQASNFRSGTKRESGVRGVRKVKVISFVDK